MSIGLVGRKLGMMRLFMEDGTNVAVSVIEAPDNRIVRRKSVEKDGYEAVQITTGERKPSRLDKATAGHYAKAGSVPGRLLAEFRLPRGVKEFPDAPALTVEQFQAGQIVDVTGVSKGKGFAGTIKRHHFAAQDATHGNSRSHRVPGSTGQRQTPGRVFKGKKMSGQLGNKQRTAQNLEVMKVDAPRSLLMIKGAVPGWTGADVVVKPASKARIPAKSPEKNK